MKSDRNRERHHAQWYQMLERHTHTFLFFLVIFFISFIYSSYVFLTSDQFDFSSFSFRYSYTVKVTA